MFPKRKLVFLQENKVPEGSSGGFRGNFCFTWVQKWLLECQVGAKMGQVGANMGQDDAKLGLRWAKLGPRWGQDGPRWAKMRQDEATMGPMLAASLLMSCENCIF